MFKRNGWLFVGLSLMVGAKAMAEPPLDFTIHEEYTSTRALGMGNAFTAVVNDHNALFYNPAALALREDWQVHMFVRAGISKDYLDLEKDLKAAKGKTPPEDATVEVIEKNYGNHFYSRVPTIGAIWARPRWSIAFIPADVSIDAAVHRQLGPQVNVNAYGDSTLAFGWARKLKSKYASEAYWGASIKALHRIYVGDSIAAADLVNDSKIFDPKDADEGMTVDADLGLLFIPKLAEKSWFRFTKPTFALVVRNLADYGFPINYHMIDKKSGEPPRLQRRIDLGSKWKLPNFWVFDPHFAVDIRNILHENWTPKKSYHVGFEAYWTMYNWWKGHWAAGINQGYMTAGVGARLAIFQFDIATFGEEVGTTSSPKESRRYLLELSIDI